MRKFIGPSTMALNRLMARRVDGFVRLGSANTRGGRAVECKLLPTNRRQVDGKRLEKTSRSF